MPVCQSAAAATGIPVVLDTGKTKDILAHTCCVSGLLPVREVWLAEPLVAAAAAAASDCYVPLLPGEGLAAVKLAVC